VIAGSIDATALGYVQEWTRAHRDELLANWERARRAEPIVPIERLLTLVYYALRSETGCRSYPISSNPKVEARSMAVMASQ
jgi:uncharacterized protein DUF4160